MLEMSFLSLKSQKPSEILIFGTFLKILAYVLPCLKQVRMQYDHFEGSGKEFAVIGYLLSLLKCKQKYLWKSYISSSGNGPGDVVLQTCTNKV